MTDLQARIEAAALALGSNPRFKCLSAKGRQQLTELVSSHMQFVLLHEMAHAITTQFGLPILGKKEDAADSFAVTRLIKLGSDFRIACSSSRERAFSWPLAAIRKRETGPLL
jgi:hypothetical protein